MNRQYSTYYSQRLQKDMHILSYRGSERPGTVPLLVIPSQDGMCDNYEGFGMIHNIADYIERGDISAFCVDTVDRESWSLSNGDKHQRGLVQEAYYQFIVDELVPWIRQMMGTNLPLTVTGCSLGATHAAILGLRRPDLFHGMIALSGVYDASYFLDGYMDSVWYDNSPVHFLPNMPADHPYVNLYNQRRFIICVGQGAWEDEGIRTMKILENACREKGINLWLDYWGYDVNHDWPWWQKQTRYFLPFILKSYREHFS